MIAKVFFAFLTLVFSIYLYQEIFAEYYSWSIDRVETEVIQVTVTPAKRTKGCWVFCTREVLKFKVTVKNKLDKRIHYDPKQLVAFIDKEQQTVGGYNKFPVYVHIDNLRLLQKETLIYTGRLSFKYKALPPKDTPILLELKVRKDKPIAWEHRW